MALAYTPPNLCIGTYTLQNDCTDKADNNTIENYIAENIEIAGAKINVFMLRGVHAQGKLMDLVGSGHPISSGTAAGSDIINAFDISASSWISAQGGASAFIGYDFGVKKTIYGTDAYAPAQPVYQHITTLRIQQSSNALNRVLQARIENSDGTLSHALSYSGVGNGRLSILQQGYRPRVSTISVVANSNNNFTIISNVEGVLGTVGLNQQFSNQDIIFSIIPDTIPFVIGDTFTLNFNYNWKRVDVINFPNTGNLETINIKPSHAAPLWRIMPTLFAGSNTDPWEVIKLELMDYQATRLDNIQDPIFMENRDRDYASTSIMIKCTYQPMDSIGDLGKFGFSLMDQYAFSCSFARMIELLGRPIVIGDIIEVEPEVQYDAELKPVKKFLEVTDCSWAAEGYSPAWKPMLYRFMASQVLPSQETRDLFGTPEEQQYIVDDGSFFDNMGQHQLTPLQITETIKAEVANDVPETGSDGASTIASGMPMVPTPNDGSDLAGRGQTDQRDMYIEDGLPPNGEPYGEGYELPDILTVHDGDYFRLNYAIEVNIPPRLFKYSALKMRWIYQETDCRGAYSSHKPSVRNALISMRSKALNE
jgi:hypothetical protein